ncbi:MAG TPA: DegT/DnrJ/EryC1/StrS family aminotransferase, partial [Solirubrobacteraceae bacterium]|nr:DegT/DnrJ/EryC1/StrS family aminotransferase [Solirubrobacteraceae bacterium]
IHYPVPIHRTAAYDDLGLGAGSLPVSESLAGRVCSLPIFPGMSEAEIEQIVDAVASFANADAGSFEQCTKDAVVQARSSDI